MQGEMGTREKIIYFGRQEFLAKGYPKASLRNIAALAHLTTGAIYAHFSHKGELFEACTSSAYEKVHTLLDDMVKKFIDEGGNALDYEPQHGLHQLEKIYDMLYGDFDAFYLLIARAEGSSRAGFVHEIIEIETEYTFRYLEKLKSRCHTDLIVSREAVHILSDSYINALLEPIRHRMDKKTALENVSLLGLFHLRGWEAILHEITKKQ